MQSFAMMALAAIIPASGFVQSMSALLTGAVAGLVCAFLVFKVKKCFDCTNSLDAFGVHGIRGTLGTQLTGR